MLSCEENPQGTGLRLWHRQELHYPQRNKRKVGQAFVSIWCHLFLTRIGWLASRLHGHAYNHWKYHLKILFHSSVHWLCMAEGFPCSHWENCAKASCCFPGQGEIEQMVLRLLFALMLVVRAKRLHNFQSGEDTTEAYII